MSPSPFWSVALMFFFCGLILLISFPTLPFSGLSLLVLSPYYVWLAVEDDKKRPR